MNKMHSTVFQRAILEEALVFNDRQMETGVKFGLSEKHTKFEKIFLVVLTNQLIYLVQVNTMRKIFSNYVRFSKSPNFTEYMGKCAVLAVS